MSDARRTSEGRALGAARKRARRHDVEEEADGVFELFVRKNVNSGYKEIR